MKLIFIQTGFSFSFSSETILAPSRAILRCC